ncbi:tetratricopeptide repeat protein [Macrococcus carouselicus]|uniref:Tetratricopeptide repeat protein n=1 Tax=Macrococcus carouselicus TaxID=69969 RepID=A0A9Q8CPN7_9STAP|nr:tetratricopeptide repeat protein [Macrococcus carouselicus]TDM04422.1 tetratricopeptide repeat protein [Macrococcus carouselicus]
MNDEQLVELIRNKQYDKALGLLFKAIDMAPDDATHYINAGTILADANKTEEAERFFQKALTLDETHGGAYYGLANIYFNQERYQEAATLYRKAVSHQLQDADTFYMLGMSFINLGDFKTAMPYLMRSYEMNADDREVAFQYGLVLCQLEMYQEAVRVLDHVLATDPQHTDALYNLALAAYMLDSDAEAALVKFRRIVEIQPDHLLAGHAINMFEQLKEE